ncbi:MAG: hypothetical protein ABL903_20705 [Methylococcales bacterium]
MNYSTPQAHIHKPRVLFVCVGNTCRSVLAEYIASCKFGKIIDVASAGLQPGMLEDTENAVFTLKTLFGVDASQHQPRDVRSIEITTFDLVVAMTNQIFVELMLLFPALLAERVVKWCISDPYGGNPAQYEHCANVIYTEMKKLPLLSSNCEKDA